MNCLDFYDNEYTDQVPKQMKIQSALSKGRTPYSSIEFISPYSPIKYNSVNVAIGRRSSGKTHAVCEELIRISSAPRIHMLIYVTKNKNIVCPTFAKFRPLIKCPIVEVEVEDIDNFLKNIISYKEWYEKVIEENKANLIKTEHPDLFEEFKEVLGIDDFKVRGLQTLVFLDDSANASYLKPKSYITSLLSENRQPRITFFINIQYWKSLGTFIKPNINTLFIFGAFSSQQVRYITQQIPMQVTFEEFMSDYRQLDNHDHIVLDCDSGKYKMIFCDA